MSNINQIVEDGVAYDIEAKALDSALLVNGFTQTTAGEKALDAAAGKTLDDAVVKKADLVNGFTQTTAGEKALDAAAGKTLYNTLAQGLITTTLTANTESTVAVSFIQSEARMLFIAHASYANSRGVYIITASAVIPVMEVPNATTLSMANGTLTIKLTTAARIVIV